MGQLFDLTQTAYDSIEAGFRGWEQAQYDFSRSGSTRYVSTNHWTQDFRDKLNYSAMVCDYGLAEIFATLLSASATIQSANINLSSTGAVTVSGASWMNTAPNNGEEVNTPSLVVQEVANGIEIGIVAGELGSQIVNLTFGIKARVNAADDTPELEDL
jgi:hypothetical protein